MMLMLYYDTSTQAVLDELQANENGLSKTEANERLRIYGSNSIKIKSMPLWRKVIEPFASVVMGVLFVAAIISFLHHATVDAIIILAIISVSATIYYVQQFSTGRILRSLQKKSEQFVSVMRDGESVKISVENLVPGDIVTLEEGDKVPADMRLISGTNVRIDEALLTGEAEPMAKSTDELRGHKEVYEQSNILFQGSFVVSGVARGVVIKTGNTTEFGKLAALSGNQVVESPVRKKIDKLVTYIIICVAIVSVLAFFLALVRGVELTEALQFVIALAVSSVPESLPVAITVVLVLGMRRMAKKKALVRNMRAIESIGVLTTIATDKTGTLTKNKLTIQTTWQPEGSKVDLPRVIHHSILGHHEKLAHDPLDVAMIEFTAATKIVKLGGEPLYKLPFDQSTSMSGNVWHHNGVYHLVVKGAPEQVIERSIMTAAQRAEAEAALTDLTSQGYRVIALASTVMDKPIDGFHQLKSKPHLQFSGLVGVADILRREAPGAIKAAMDAGVTVRMITGDHFETAYHIGRQLGLIDNRDQVFDSRKMNDMSDKDLSKIIENIRVFSRVVPENKYRILELLKANNITAMTGDGVNDVPALTNAHVGVAMGSGSQIAKDAGDIILLDNNFRTIIAAMREGRIIYSNIRRMLYYLLAASISEAIVLVGALVLDMPIPLLAVQILWVNLVTDTALVIPLGLEPGGKDIMKRKPMAANAPILDRYMVSRVIVASIGMAAVTLGMYAYFSANYGHEYGQTIAFAALVVMQWSNALSSRSDLRSVFRRIRVLNWPFYIALAGAIGIQALALFGPLSGPLSVSSVAIGDLYTTGIIAFLTPLIVVEIHKFIGRRINKHRHKKSQR